ncbi:peptidase [Halorubrum persicum]|uniref:Peptidase n=1 Tax=Halorubrum persicum TaxID=1383844 RepID=A0A2G1WFV0_9EURY|nr:Xaa-Pro peptidase family protein [Halorubrum persicum]PHQ37884.1 peptidase [Halorubrum persicum]
MNYEDRLAACQKQLSVKDAEALMLFPSVDMQYLSGFTDEPMERHLFLILGENREPAFVAPELYKSHIKDDSWVDDVRTYSDGGDPLALVAEVADDLGIGEGRLLVDDRMWAQFTIDLHETFPEADFGLASEVIGELRVQKSDAEIGAIRRAGAAADAAIADVRNLGSDAVGMTEAELGAYIEDRLTTHGGEENSFAPIVGSGPNGAKPHHRHGNREIDFGDPVVLDFGTRIGGYPSDQTRTVVFGGDPPAEFEVVHEVVREAQQVAVEAVQPGVPVEAVDAAAREVIVDAGYGDAFIHRTGHGLGLEVHEDPYIVGGNDEQLQEGMVFSVEPGVYLEGKFGVRIEDIVVVTTDGCERLNNSSRDWQV